MSTHEESRMAEDTRRHPGAAVEKPGDDVERVEPTAGPVPQPPVADPIPDPGVQPDVVRLADVEPNAERRAERQVAGMFGLAALLVLGFIVAFIFIPIDTRDVVSSVRSSNLALGLTLGLALFLIGAGAIHWAKKLMPDHEVIHERHELRSTDEVREETLQDFWQGADESGFGRRKLIRNSLIGALALLPLPAVVLLRDLGPLPGNIRTHTIWAENVRLMTDNSEDPRPLRPSDLQIGSMVNVMPENFYDLPEEGSERLNARAKEPVILVRMEPSEITPAPGREDWNVDGIVAYSKICTHVGCPISLYEQLTHNALCPCHQSTFNLADNGKVIFGPAARNLPQLPLTVDEEGYLVAASDFTEPVGPSYWERG